MGNRKINAAWEGWPASVPYPGLGPASDHIPLLVADVAKREAALAYKEKNHCPWIVFFGGTGTGKSTLFNAFCGKDISDTGVERPKTTGPILYAHASCPLASGFPFQGLSVDASDGVSSNGSLSTGHPQRLHVITHRTEDVHPLVIVDTPDLDSVEDVHREVAANIYYLADLVVFVASQEKYADEVPCRFLAKVLEEKRPIYFLLNKVTETFSKDDILKTLAGREISLDENRLWMIAHEPMQPSRHLSRQHPFRAFAASVEKDLFQAGDEQSWQVRLGHRREDLTKRSHQLLQCLKEENDLARKWMAHLSALCAEASVTLLEEEKKKFLQESSGYIQQEVRKLFSRYDVLAKPRKLLQSVFRTPLEVLGVIKARTHRGQKKDLTKVRAGIAFSPVWRTVDRLNKQVLKKLSPKDTSVPLYQAMRRPAIALSEDEMKAIILKEQDLLDQWVAERFQELSRQLPTGKKWGIYSTTVLWGVLILSFEVIVGGGFTVLDAALDSVLAPFVTKGVVGLFASREIQKVARELATRYEQGLLSVIVEQKKRYEDCMAALLPSQEILDRLEALVQNGRSSMDGVR